jgi:hypothetical protein
MPCRDYEGMTEADNREDRVRTEMGAERNKMQARLDKLTEMLCSVLVLVDSAVPLRPDIEAWWTEHKRRDRERHLAEERALEYKKAREEQEAKRAEFIAKMTPEERKLLGLNRSY